MKFSVLFPWFKKAPASAPQPPPVSYIIPLHENTTDADQYVNTAQPEKEIIMKILIALCEMTGDDPRTVTVTDSKGKDHTLDLAHSQAHIEVGTQGASISVDGGKRKSKAD